MREKGRERNARKGDTGIGDEGGAELRGRKQDCGIWCFGQYTHPLTRIGGMQKREER